MSASRSGRPSGNRRIPVDEDLDLTGSGSLDLPISIEDLGSFEEDEDSDLPGPIDPQALLGEGEEGFGDLLQAKALNPSEDDDDDEYEGVGLSEVLGLDSLEEGEDLDLPESGEGLDFLSTLGLDALEEGEDSEELLRAKNPDLQGLNLLDDEGLDSPREDLDLLGEDEGVAPIEAGDLDLLGEEDLDLTGTGDLDLLEEGENLILPEAGDPDLLGEEDLDVAGIGDLDLLEGDGDPGLPGV